MSIPHVRTTPILRSFNEAAARAFYVDYDARTACARWDAFINTVAPDELSRELTARGVAVHVPPENADDGLTGFEARDLDGYVLFFGHPV